MTQPWPFLITGDREIDSAFRIALGDIAGNIVPLQDGLLETESPVLLAGLGYERPWTRDTAFNIWNGASLLHPRVMHHSLLSVLQGEGENVQAGGDGQYGQYWDSVIWALGAWWHYIYTGDREFLEFALKVTHTTLTFFEATEFDPEFSLFRGPAVYGDGVSAYPDSYADAPGSNILTWATSHPDYKTASGHGLPMYTLSTNCLYYHVFSLAERMATELGVAPDPGWGDRATALKGAIEQYFWLPQHGHFRYLNDPFGGSDRQEGLGHAFALLFGLTDSAQADAILRNQHITPAGIPCLWPAFQRYQGNGTTEFGRHSGTVWPHIQALWAHAAALAGSTESFAFELRALAHHACRDGQFSEVYHPLTGRPYGGWQENGSGISPTQSQPRQTWSATGYLRMILAGLAGMAFEPDGIRFQPTVPRGMDCVRLGGLAYRDMNLEVIITGSGTAIESIKRNGTALGKPFLPATMTGPQCIEIRLAS
jgi:glycogen debranching enzyme